MVAGAQIRRGERTYNLRSPAAHVPNDMKKQNRAVESSTATQNSSDAAPTILNGEPIPPLKLPEGFDFTYHLQVVAAGKVKPTTHEEFQQLIAELKSSKKKWFGLIPSPRRDFARAWTILGAMQLVLRCLDEIAQLGLAWDEFKRTYGWMPVKLVGEQTYPGALELHRFHIASRSGSRFQVVGCTYEKVVVVCAIALRN